jgi:hypothetical protein
VFRKRKFLPLVLVLWSRSVFAADPITTHEAVASDDGRHFSQRFSFGKKYVVVEIRGQAFQKTNHKLTLDDGGGVRRVDGHRALGTDAGPPDTLKSEIVRMDVSWNGTRHSVEKRFFADCFNTSAIPSRVLVSDDFQAVMITLYGGDGAGAYGVTWIVSDDGVVRRFVAETGDF